MRKKIVSGFLALAMVFTSVPTDVIALGTGGISGNDFIYSTSLRGDSSSSTTDSSSSTSTSSGTTLKPSGSSDSSSSSSSTSSNSGTTLKPGSTATSSTTSSSTATSSTTSSSTASSNTTSSSTSSSTSTYNGSTLQPNSNSSSSTTSSSTSTNNTTNSTSDYGISTTNEYGTSTVSSSYTVTLDAGDLPPAGTDAVIYNDKVVLNKYVEFDYKGDAYVTNGQGLSSSVQAEPSALVDLDSVTIALSDDKATISVTVPTNLGTSNVSYQWHKVVASGDDDKIGTDSSSYTIVEDDAGELIYVVVTIVEGHTVYNAKSVTSTNTITVPSTGDTTVELSGVTIALSGTTISITNPTDLGTSNVSYQWDQDTVTKGTDSTYAVTDDDAGKDITVKVTISSGHDVYNETTTAVTSNVISVPSATPTTTELKDITIALNENKDTISISSHSDIGTDNVTYEWKSNGALANATNGATYTIGDADAGKEIYVEVTISTGHTFYDVTATAVSSDTVTVDKATLSNVDISFDNSTNTLSIDDTKLSSNATYQWYANSNTSTVLAITETYKPIATPSHEATETFYVVVKVGSAHDFYEEDTTGVKSDEITLTYDDGSSTGTSSTAGWYDLTAGSTPASVSVQLGGGETYALTENYVPYSRNAFMFTLGTDTSTDEYEIGDITFKFTTSDSGILSVRGSTGMTNFESGAIAAFALGDFVNADTDYFFVGWKADQAVTYKNVYYKAGETIPYAGVSTMQLTADTALTAIWSNEDIPTSGELDYSLDLGEYGDSLDSSYDFSSLTDAQILDILENGLDNYLASGYLFDGWYLNADFSDSPLPTTQDLIDAVKNGDKIYAKIELDTSTTVSYITLTGTVTDSTANKYLLEHNVLFTWGTNGSADGYTGANGSYTAYNIPADTLIKIKVIDKEGNVVWDGEHMTGSVTPETLNIDISKTSLYGGYNIEIKLGNQDAQFDELKYERNAVLQTGVWVSGNDGSTWYYYNGSTSSVAHSLFQASSPETLRFRIGTDYDGYLALDEWDTTRSNYGVTEFQDEKMPVFKFQDFDYYTQETVQVGWIADQDVYFCYRDERAYEANNNAEEIEGGEVVFVKAGELIPLTPPDDLDSFNRGIDGVYFMADTTLTAIWATESYSFELYNNRFYFDKYGLELSAQGNHPWESNYISIRTDIIYTYKVQTGLDLEASAMDDSLLGPAGWVTLGTGNTATGLCYVMSTEDYVRVTLDVWGIDPDCNLELFITMDDLIYSATYEPGDFYDTEYIFYLPRPDENTVAYVTCNNGYVVLDGNKFVVDSQQSSLKQDVIVKFQSIFDITLDSAIFLPFEDGDEDESYVASFEAGEDLSLNFNDFKADPSHVFEAWVMTNTSTGDDVTKDLLKTNSATASFTMPAHHLTISAEYRDSDGYIVYFYEISGNNSKLTQEYLSDGDKVEEPEDPERAGYTFTGWYTDSDWETLWDFDTEVDSSDFNSSKAMTLYAGWEGNTVTLKIDYDGANYTCNNDGKTFKVGDAVTIDAGKKSGAMFSFWSWTSSNWDTSSSAIPSMESTVYCSDHTSAEAQIIIPPVEDGKVLEITANWDSLTAYLVVDKIVSPDSDGDSCSVVLYNADFGSITGVIDEDYSTSAGKERYFFDLEGYGAGMYRVDIATSSGQIMTGVFDIYEDTYNYHSIELLPIGKIPSIHNSSNTIRNLASNNMNEMFTAAELSSTANVSIDMVVQDVASSSPDAQLILDSITTAQGVGVFLDITLQKQITDGTNVTKYTMQPANSKGLNVTVHLPDSFKGQKGYFVSTVHEGEYSQLSSANVIYDEDTNSISFYATNLSVFGIGYTGTVGTSGFNSSIPTAEGYYIPLFQNVIVGQWIEGLGKIELVHPDSANWKFAGWYYGTADGTPGATLTAAELTSFMVTQSILDYGIYPRFVQVDGSGNPLGTLVPQTGTTLLGNLF